MIGGREDRTGLSGAPATASRFQRKRAESAIRSVSLVVGIAAVSDGRDIA
jgi:hypothetical protein